MAGAVALAGMAALLALPGPAGADGGRREAGHPPLLARQAPQQAQAGRCAHPDSASSADTVLAVRALQTRLMVAALSCGERRAYHAFIVRYGSALKHNARALHARYGGTGGSGGVDRLVTRLANAAAASNARDPAAFCRNTRTTLDQLVDGRMETLERVALSGWVDAGCPGR